MAIKPACDMCGNELTVFGALLFSPPDQDSKTIKFHLCQDCYKKLATELKKKI